MPRMRQEALRAEPRSTLSSLRRLGWLLDASISLPGGFRIGWDAVLGLVPGIGDLAGSAVSLYIVAVAWRHGIPAAVLGRMLLNVGLETVIGSIPVLGDVFDMAFKANLRNVRLAERYLAAPAAVRRRSTTVLVVFAVAGFAFLLAALLLTVFLLSWVVATLTH